MVRVVVVSLLLVLLCAQSGVGLQLGRRGAVRLAGSGAVAALVQPLAALATTAADKEPSPEFEASAARRQAFLEKQKKYKKAWRNSLVSSSMPSTIRSASLRSPTWRGASKRMAGRSRRARG